MNKKILIVLGVSLALNFLFIGFEVSRAVFEPPYPYMPAERFDFRPDGYKGRENVPDINKDANRKVFFGAFKKAFEDARKPMADSKKAIADAVRKDPFDPEALKKALDEASAVRAKFDDKVQDNMLEIISNMTPEERAAFANSFERKHHRAKDPKVRPEKRRRPLPPSEPGMEPPPPPPHEPDMMMPPPPPAPGMIPDPRRDDPDFRRPRHHRLRPHHREMMPPCDDEVPAHMRRPMPDDEAEMFTKKAKPAKKLKKAPKKLKKNGEPKPVPQEGSTPQK